MGFVACLRPYDPRRGCVARSYAHAGFDLRFVEGVPVRGLSAKQSEELRKLRQPGKGKEALLDVYSDEEWEEFVARQAAAKLGLPAAVVARSAPQAPPPPSSAEALDHTDVGGIRVQHTQDAPPDPATEIVAPKGPKRKGGGR